SRIEIIPASGIGCSSDLIRIPAPTKTTRLLPGFSIQTPTDLLWLLRVLREEGRWRRENSWWTPAIWTNLPTGLPKGGPARTWKLSWKRRLLMDALDPLESTKS